MNYAALTRLFAPLLAATAATGCVNTAVPPRQSQPAFDAAEIRAAERALISALEAADTTTWVYHYTEDTVYVPPGAPAVEGRKALLEMARAMTPLSKVSISSLRTEGSGNLAYVYGNASWTYEGTTSHVRLVLVWRKEADGQWRIAQEIQNVPPPGG
jgi:ketosteroid isomerase-like protein